MWRDQADVEGEALAAIREASGDPSRPESIMSLAPRHPLIEGIEEVAFLPAPARTRRGLRDPDRSRIQVRGGLTVAARQWWGTHEFGEVRLAHQGLDATDGAERLADRFAAAVICPRIAFLRVWDDLSDRVDTFPELVSRLGRRFHATAKTVLLRMSEVRDVPVAIFTEGFFWPLRGMTHGLPDDRQLRAMIAAFERKEPLPRGWRVTRIRKSPKGPWMWVVTGDG